MTGSPDDQIAGPSPPSTGKPSFVHHWVAAGSVLLMMAFLVVGIPRLIRSQWRSQWASVEANFVVGDVRSINTACVSYVSTYPKRGYSPTLSALGPPLGNNAPSADAAGLIDLRLARGQKSGYRFTYLAFDHDGDGRFEAYTLNADPLDPERHPRRLFSDQSGVIRTEEGRPASESSPPLQ